jgi:hypothetical protein
MVGLHASRYEKLQRLAICRIKKEQVNAPLNLP